MRTVVLGSQGMLGSVLVSELRQWWDDIELLTYDQNTLDILDFNRLQQVMVDVNPDVIINTAAYTDVDGCETNKALALAVNGLAVNFIAEVAEKVDAKVVHYSSEFVFDGKSTDEYQELDFAVPLSTYGFSKALGDKYLLDSRVDSILIRTQGLFGPHGGNFPKTVMSKALRKQPMKVIRDQIGRVTATVDLAEATCRLLNADFSGIINFANPGVVNKYEVAKQVYELVGVPELLFSCTAEEYAQKTPGVALRPKNGVLDLSAYQKLMPEHEVSSWDFRVEEYIKWELLHVK
jgi:dTDP-4-dehydrorhamnose reductase